MSLHPCLKAYWLGCCSIIQLPIFRTIKKGTHAPVFIPVSITKFFSLFVCFCHVSLCTIDVCGVYGSVYRFSYKCCVSLSTLSTLHPQASQCSKARPSERAAFWNTVAVLIPKPPSRCPQLCLQGSALWWAYWILIQGFQNKIHNCTMNYKPIYWTRCTLFSLTVHRCRQTVTNTESIFSLQMVILKGTSLALAAFLHRAKWMSISTI